MKVDLEEQKRNTGGNLQNADGQIPGKLVCKRAKSLVGRCGWL